MDSIWIPLFINLGLNERMDGWGRSCRWVRHINLSLAWIANLWTVHIFKPVSEGVRPHIAAGHSTQGMSFWSFHYVTVYQSELFYDWTATRIIHQILSMCVCCLFFQELHLHLEMLEWYIKLFMFLFNNILLFTADIFDQQCCQIDCYTLRDCKLATSSHCTASPVECAMGDAYRYTIQPVFQNLKKEFQCHIKHKKPAALYTMFFHIKVKENLALYLWIIKQTSFLRYIWKGYRQWR